MWRFVRWWGNPRDLYTCTLTWQVAALWEIARPICCEKSSTNAKDEGPSTLNCYTYNKCLFPTKWLKSFKRKWQKPMETWSSSEQGTPLSRCTTKDIKRRRRRRQRKSQTKRRQRKQRGEGVGAVVAGIAKAAWKITQGLETLAFKECSKGTSETHGGNQKW